MTHVREIAATDKRFVAGSGNNKRAKSFVVAQFCHNVYEPLLASDSKRIPFLRIVEGHASDHSGVSPVVKIDKDEVVDFGIIGHWSASYSGRSGSSADNASSTASVC